jgi:hypothetical protein
MQKWSWMMIGSSFQNNQQQQHAFTLASLTIVGIIFVIDQRYDYTSCFGVLFSRRDEDNNNNSSSSSNNNNTNNKQSDPNDDDKINDRKGKIEDNEENKATTCIDDVDKNPTPKIIPFPWEPKATNITTAITNETTKPTINSSRKHIASFPPAAYTTSSRSSSSSTNHHKKEKEELDFLATMSFANGGMRSPNCPCCY